MNSPGIGFDAFYCQPGKDGAHEKGGVEQEGSRFRRTHLVPVPEVESLAELKEKLAVIDAAEDRRHVHGSPTPVGVNFAVEAPLLAPLPGEEFECGATLTPTVNRYSRVVVRQCYYSMPARFIGAKVRLLLRANEVLVFDGRRLMARHPRINRRYDYRDDLDHFIEILIAKPVRWPDRPGWRRPAPGLVHRRARAVLDRGQAHPTATPKAPGY
ncbi:Mu transposase domain-containing protein [Phytohabitans sp. LJ34]|uniref:Mu transposase domain-containing protein n=1 Tax=Phytohabitans sp. LJ34 TaxID=3452217 RepID=UPI003F898DE2